MAHYKLTYFHMKGRAEVARMLFAVAEVDFDDVRLSQTEWEQSKKDLDPPFGQLPILEVDKKNLCQSHTIDRYLAKQFGLAGSCDWEAARCDMVAQCVEDMLKDILNVHQEENQIKKETLKTQYINYLHTSLDKLSELLAENADNSGYFVGKNLTYADLTFYHYPFIIEYFIKHRFNWDRWPTLKLLREKVEGHAKVKDWIKKRPKTEL